MYLDYLRLKVKLCLFVLDCPTHNLPPDSKNYIAFSQRKNIFYSLPPKSLIACQESGFYHIGSVVLWTYAFLLNLNKDTPNGKKCINEREIP